MFKFQGRLNVVLIVVPGLLGLLTAAAFFPGIMPFDTIGFVYQALTGRFNDVHAPLIAAFWRILFFLWDNVGNLFCVHVILYWFFWALLALVSFKEWHKQLFVLALAALPPLWSQTIVVGTDTELSLALLGSYLFLVMSVLTQVDGRPKNNFIGSVCIGFGIFFFTYSAAVRSNSLPALIPLAYFMVRAILGKPTLIRAILLTCCICGMGLLSTYWLNYGWLKAAKNHIFQAEEIFDIAGVFSQAPNIELIPPYWKMMNHQFTPEMLSQNYTPYSEVPFTSWGHPIIPMTADPQCLNALTRKWIMAISQYPSEFLRHRWAVFKRLMGVGEPRIYYALFFDTCPNQLGIEDLGDPMLQKGFKTYFIYFRNSLFFRGWFYLFILFAMVPFQWFKLPDSHRLKIPAICCALSALLYGMSYFIISPCAEFRLLYPMVALTLFSLVLTLSSAATTEEEKRTARSVTTKS